MDAIRKIEEFPPLATPVTAPPSTAPAQPKDPAPVPVAPSQITLDFKQATELLGMFGGEPSTVTLAPGDGHGGKGLYAYWSDIPEEGAIYLGVTDDEAIPLGGAGGSVGASREVLIAAAREAALDSQRIKGYMDWGQVVDALQHANRLTTPAAEQGDAKDAQRYRWLKSRLLCADFNYGEPSEICYALVFEIPQDVRVSANLDATIDDAILAGATNESNLGVKS